MAKSKVIQVIDDLETKGLLDPNSAEQCRQITRRTDDAIRSADNLETGPIEEEIDLFDTDPDGGKGLLAEDQAEGLRKLRGQLDPFGFWSEDDLKRIIAHDMVTLKDMLNPERIADAKYLRDVRSWITSLDEHIDRLEFERSGTGAAEGIDLDDIRTQVGEPKEAETAEVPIP